MILFHGTNTDIETIDLSRSLNYKDFGKGFYLDREAGLEDLIYTDDTRPFYAGEIAATFVLPATERNVTEWLRN
jgi:hypothetical protein